MAQQVRTLSTKPEFNPQYYYGGKRELNPANGPLTSTH